MQTSEVLNLAADLIEKRGWTNGGGWFPDALPPDAPLCVEGALKVAARELAPIGTHWSDLHYGVNFKGGGSKDALQIHLGGEIPFSWNDRPGRTASEVIEVLRACAVIEAAREEQDAAWATYADVVSA